MPNFDNLSKDQINIAEANKNARVLVLAGPGTGKTHTLLRRLIYLVDHEHLDPMNEILVLSFSRTAITEIRKRLLELSDNKLANNIKFVNILTFDSFATRLIIASDQEEDLSGLGYEERINLAINRLSNKNSESSAILSGIKHIVVDEIQDLVGNRAKFVQNILKLAGPGFTLLGDPAQGIFNYLVEEQQNGPTSDEFLEWVQQEWRASLQVISLNENYRIRTESVNIAANLRPLVLTPNSKEEANLGLRKMITDLQPIDMEKNNQDCIYNPNGKSIAILCRTNAEALFVSHLLNQKGAKSIVPPKVEEKGLPPWLGRIFGAWEGNQISKEIFLQRWIELIGKDYFENPEMAWENLKLVEGAFNENINLGLLKKNLRRGQDWTFESEVFQGQNMVIVSTIHQAKGREFDQVVILSPDKAWGKTEGLEKFYEARIMYVAATRAREQMFRLGRVGFPIINDTPFRSFQKRYNGLNGNGVHFMEAGIEEDIFNISLVNNGLFANQDLAANVQDFIWKKMAPGEPLVIIPKKSGNKMQFIIAWENKKSNKVIPLGLMGQSFVKDIFQFCYSFATESIVKYPILRGLHVYERRTIILPPYQERVYEPWSTSGFFLGLGVKGMIEIPK